MNDTRYAKYDLDIEGGWIIPLNDNDEALKISAYIVWGAYDPELPQEFDVYALTIEGHYMETGDETFEAIYKNRRERIDTLIEEMWSYHIREIERFDESPKTVPPRWID